MVEPTDYKLRLRDVVEIVVGGCVLAFPVAATEEIWNISETLSVPRVLYLSISSVLVIAAFTYQRYFSGRIRGNVGHLALRVLAVYFVTMAVSASG